MTPELYHACQKAVHVITADGKVLKAGRASLFVLSELGYPRWLLCPLMVPPLVWLVLEKPLAVAVLYTILASLITPFIAATLLYMNNRTAWVGEARNGKAANAVLVLSLVLFLYLLIKGVVDMAGKIA